jgi:hypothetical protein
MAWYAYLAYFAAGALLANGVPHFVNGIWGLANFAGGFALIFGVGYFRFGLNREVIMVGLGALAISVILALYFGRVRKG